MPDIFTVTVSQINRRLATIVKGDKALNDVYVNGEISNFTLHQASGHIYFTLKDETASIKCVMFAGYASKLSFMPQSGMSVLIHAGVGVYERDGANQLYVTEIMPQGVGEMYLAFQQAKQTLEKEGYFSQKRVLPAIPRKVCIITAIKGAALQDMLNILSRRLPILTVIVIPVTVQGVTSPASLIKGIEAAQNTDADVIIIGRGGGSAEDLSAFNDVEYAKALFRSRIPTVSAVGHETDTTISDYVADRRAPTPSAAAELVTPVPIGDITAGIDSTFSYIRGTLLNLFEEQEKKLDNTERHILALTPAKKLDSYSRELELISKNIYSSAVGCINKYETLLQSKIDYISALNPLTVLGRGYSFTEKQGEIVKSVDELTENDTVVITLKDGCFEATVQKISKEEGKQ